MAKKTAETETEPKAPKTPKPLALGKLAIRKDPRVYATEIARVVPPYKRIVGLDLGTNCGVSFCDMIPGVPIKNAKLVVGQWDLSCGDYDSGVLRHIRLKQFLSVLQPDLILFEEVKYTPPVIPGVQQSPAAIAARVATAAEFLGSLKATVAIWAEERGIPAQGVGIADIKKYATGVGNASKELMIAAANEKLGLSLPIEDYDKTGADNMADSVWVCAMGVERYGEGLDGESAHPAS